MFIKDSIYSSRDSTGLIHYLFVLDICLNLGAVYAVQFDETYRIEQKRWFLVRHFQRMGDCNPPYTSNAYSFMGRSSLVFSDLKIVEDSACVPPPEVLDYFRDHQQHQ